MFFALSCLVAAFFYFLGLGSLLLPLWKRQWPRLAASENATKLQAALLASGLALHHAITLAVPGFSFAWSLGVLLALTGWMVSRRFASTVRRRLWPYSRWASAGLALLFVCFTRHCISGPFDEWDARSIWFFHAKILYFAQSAHVPLIWNDPSISFSHPPYPKLLPALAALAARLAGTWNDIFPRFGFALLAIPAFFNLASVRDRFWPLLWVWFGLVLSQYTTLSFGYADGFCALYAALGILFCARAVHSGDPLDSWQGLACLALSAQIKHEGVLAACIVLALMAGYHLLRKSPRLSFSLLATAVAVFSGVALWFFWVKVWGVAEPVALTGGSFLSRVARQAPEGIPVLLRRFLITSKLGVFGLILCAVGFLGRRGRAVAWPLLVGAPVLYVLALSLAYLGTPHDFAWHVSSSIDRTALMARGFLVVAVYFAFSRVGVAKVEAQPETDRAR